MIIDAHTHYGYDYIFEEDLSLKDLLTNMEKHKIDISIVQPGTVLDLKTVKKQHNKISTLSKKMPGRIFGMANPNPHLPKNKYSEELERCVKDLGFVGVKLNTLAHAVSPSLNAGRMVFELASKLEIPVMVHTGEGIPWSLPSKLIPIAKEFPNLNIILAHCGGSIFSCEAILAAQMCPNIYLETSWIPGLTIREFCKSIGAHRVMFGSDVGNNVAEELTKYKTIDLTKEELDWCLWRTAAKVFRITISNERT